MSDIYEQEGDQSFGNDDALMIVDKIIFDLRGQHLTDLEQIIVEQCLQNKSYKAIANESSWSVGHIRNIAQLLWRGLEKKLNVPVTKPTLRQALSTYKLSTVSTSWGNAPDVSIFFGRENEKSTLKQWIFDDGCRLVGIFGLGGVGKTNLATRFALDAQQDFDAVIWYELINAPPIKETLSALNQFLSNSPDDKDEELLGNQISQFMQCLQRKRCLVVLDNFESVLSGQNFPGEFPKGYEGYGQLLRQVGEVGHQSCMMLTSREKPRILSTFEGKQGPTRSLALDGLREAEARRVFDAVGQFSGLEQWSQLHAFYNGNPLALKLVARHIQEVFNGDISTFQAHGKSVFADILQILDEHFERMSANEQQISTWLSISRVPVTFAQLRSHLFSLSAKDDLANSIQSLRRRLPIEVRANGFTLQPVLMEFFREKFVTQVVQEIIDIELDTFNQYAILQAASEEHIKESQVRVIVTPILNKLLDYFHTTEEIERHLTVILAKLQASPTFQKGYAGGNILNLLCNLTDTVSGYDFSGITIRQGDLQGKRMLDVNFSQTSFEESSFSQNFSGIHGLSFSPDGQLLAAGGTDGFVIVFKVSDGQRVLSLQHDPSKFAWVPTVAFHPDQPLLASAGFNQQIKLWDTRTGQQVRTLKGHASWIWTIAFSPEGQLLASGGTDQTIRVWNCHTGECIQVIEAHDQSVQSVAFSPDGQYLASSSFDQVIHLWNIKTWTRIRSFTEHESVIGDVSFSPDSSTLMSVSADTTVRLWNVSTGECQKILRGHPDAVRSGRFCRDNRVASGGLNGYLRIWDVDTGQCIYNLRGHSDWVRVMAASPCGEIIASADLDQTIKLWNINTGQCIRTINGHCTWPWTIAFHPSGGTLASGHLDKTVRFWDIASGECTHTLDGHRGWITVLAYHPHGHIIASGSYDSTVRIWDASTGECIQQLFSHPLGVRSLSFSPDGQMLASSGDDVYINVWKVGDWSPVHTLNGHEGWIPSIAFADDSESLVSCSADDTIKVWSIRTGTCIRSIPSKVNLGRTPCLVISSNGEVIVAGNCDQPIQTWNIVTGEFLGFIEDHQNKMYTTLALSPDASRLAIAGDSNMVQIRHPLQDQSYQTLDQHDNMILAVAISGDGNQVASASLDENIKIWDLKSGTCLQSLSFTKPYQGTNIKGITGITEAQKSVLLDLGAVAMR